MEYLVILLSIGCIVVGVLIFVINFLRRKSPAAEEEEVVERRRVPVARGGDGPPRRAGRNVRARMRAAANRQDDDDEDFEEEEDLLAEEIAMPEGKIGAKKRKKLEMKAEKKYQRERELEEREERKRRNEEMEEMRKKREEKEKAEELQKEAEEKARKEEQEAKELEEYLKLKASFEIESEGFDETIVDEESNKFQEFINYIKEQKVVLLEDLASHFNLKTQDAINRVQSLLEEETLVGVIDDRGKFIYITREELDSVATFIKQRGRVSITELAEASNSLVNLNNKSVDVC